MRLHGSAMTSGVTSGGGGIDGGSPPPPAPSTSSPPAGVIVQVGPGSNSSTNSASSTPSSMLTSPVTTPPAPAPTSSSTFYNIFGVNPLAFPAFSSNVTLTSNHVRAGSQDAAFVPNSPSTNITVPVIAPHPLHQVHNQLAYHQSSGGGVGVAPLAVLSSPSLGSTPTSPLFSPSSSSLASAAATSPVDIGSGIVSIDVASPASTPHVSGASSVCLPVAAASSSSAASSTLPSSSCCIMSSSSSAPAAAATTASTSFPVIQSSSHMNSNAISGAACSLNQSIAAGGITPIAQSLANFSNNSVATAATSTTSNISETGAPQHCLLVSCNPPSLVTSTEAQTDNNSSSTISIAPPPPPSRSREHRKRERRERRRDRSYRSSASTSGAPGSSSTSTSRAHLPSSYHHHHHNNHHQSQQNGGGGSSGNTTRAHHHSNHQAPHKVRSVKSCSSFNSGNASCSSVTRNGSSASNFLSSASGPTNHSSGSVSNLCDNSSALQQQADELVISEVHSERGRGDPIESPPPPLDPQLVTEGPLILGPPGASPSLMPDLLDSHFPAAPPPYSTLPHHPPMPLGPAPVPIPLIPSPVPVPILPAPPPPTLISPAACIPAQPVRYHFSTAAARASRRSLRTHRGVPYASEEEPKTCCGMSASQAVSIRWFIIVIAVIGICCTLAGTALGAARSAGKEHLTLSLLMIGVGVLLLTVSAVAWRLTANESGSSCRAMLGFARSASARGDGGAEPNRRFVPRLPPSYGRPHHPYAAMMYPEFSYRQPPPSYQASMQEYRLRLLLLERSNPTIAAFGSAAMGHGHGPVTMVPPPPYRPYSANMRMLPHARVEDYNYSRPPSYRSRTSGNNTGEYGADGAPSRPSLDPSVGHHHPHHHHHHIIESPMHSRDPSLLSYLSQQSVDNMSVVSGHVTNHHHHGNPGTTTATVVTVVQAVSVGMDIPLGPPYDADDDGKGLASLEVVDDKSCYDPEDRDNKDGNMVRIVQTTDSSQVIGRDSVIVTVSGGAGSGPTLWDTYHHLNPSATSYAVAVTTPPQLTPTSNSTVITTSAPSTTLAERMTERDQQSNLVGGEVQILAHL